MNRLLISLAAASALLLGNASYAVTNTVPAASAKSAATAATPPAKLANANAATPTVAPSAKAAPVAKAAVAKTPACRDAKGKFIKCPTAARK